MRSFNTRKIVRGIAAPAAMSIGLLFALSACGGDANEAETTAESAYESMHDTADAAIEAAHDAMDSATEHGEAMLHGEDHADHEEDHHDEHHDDEHHDDDEDETSYP